MNGGNNNMKKILLFFCIFVSYTSYIFAQSNDIADKIFDMGNGVKNRYIITPSEEIYGNMLAGSKIFILASIGLQVENYKTNKEKEKWEIQLSIFDRENTDGIPKGSRIMIKMFDDSIIVLKAEEDGYESYQSNGYHNTYIYCLISKANLDKLIRLGIKKVKIERAIRHIEIEYDSDKLGHLFDTFMKLVKKQLKVKDSFTEGF